MADVWALAVAPLAVVPLFVAPLAVVPLFVAPLFVAPLFVAPLFVAPLAMATVALAAVRTQAQPQARPAAANAALTPAPPQLRAMVGTWDVRQRMWTGPDAPPTTAALVARRRLVGDTFLEEVMEPAPGSGQPAFTRTAYLSRNAVRRQYEYVVLDTRAPQIMYETSAGGREPDARTVSDSAWVYLDSFVAPQWGTTTNATFRQRRVIAFGADRQVVRQYFTPLAEAGGPEFLAVEYVYTRAR